MICAGLMIGRDVDVGGLEIVEQLVMLDERVDEADMIGDAQFGGQRLQPVAIGLAFVRDEMRVGRAEHRHRARSGSRATIAGSAAIIVSMPLLGREQAEGQHHVAPVPAEPRLEIVSGSANGAVGHAVRDDDDHAAARAVDALQNFAAALGHHDHARGAAQQRLDHPALIGVRLFEHGVQRDDHRERHPVEQREDQHSPAGPPKMPYSCWSHRRLRAAASIARAASI